jgi:hypothetical protein
VCGYENREFRVNDRIFALRHQSGRDDVHSNPEVRAEDKKGDGDRWPFAVVNGPRAEDLRKHDRSTGVNANIGGISGDQHTRTLSASRVWNVIMTDCRIETLLVPDVQQAQFHSQT